MLCLKSPELIHHWESLHPILKELVLDVYLIFNKEFKIDLIITSLIRTDEPNSVHCYGRGADVRTHNLTDAQKENLEKKINVEWDYGDTKHNCAYIHGKGWNEHLHLQVRDETTKNFKIINEDG